MSISRRRKKDFSYRWYLRLAGTTGVIRSDKTFKDQEPLVDDILEKYPDLDLIGVDSLSIGVIDPDTGKVLRENYQFAKSVLDEIGIFKYNRVVGLIPSEDRKCK